MSRLKCPQPQLATLTKTLPYGPNWSFELKYDGYRILAAAGKNKVTLYTRNCLDWTGKFQHIEESLKGLKEGTVVDGELVAENEKNKISFASLQQSIKQQSIKGKKSKLKYYIFDLLFYNNNDLRGLPLSERRKLLEKYIKFNKQIILAPQYPATELEGLLRQVEKEGLEGIIAKNPESEYQAKRTKSWLKFKINQHEEFVICGYTLHSKQKHMVGSLLIGLFTGKKELTYCGKVGTGFSMKERSELYKYLNKYRTKVIIANKGLLPKKVNLCTPKLICEIGFTEWTPDGLLRHPRYLGLRTDKKAGDVKLKNSSRQSAKI